MCLPTALLIYIMLQKIQWQLIFISNLSWDISMDRLIVLCKCKCIVTTTYLDLTAKMVVTFVYPVYTHTHRKLKYINNKNNKPKLILQNKWTCLNITYSQEPPTATVLLWAPLSLYSRSIISSSKCRRRCTTNKKNVTEIKSSFQTQTLNKQMTQHKDL